MALGLLLIVRAGAFTWLHKYIGWVRQDRFLRRDAAAALRLAKRHLRRTGTATELRRSEDAEDQRLREACARLQQALRIGFPSRVISCLDGLLFVLGSPPQLPIKSSVREFLESIAFAVLLTQLLNALVVEWVEIPSGSMLPTLQFGDHVVVIRMRYGLRLPGTDHRLFAKQARPQRGDVVSFVFPQALPSRWYRKGWLLPCVVKNRVFKKDSSLWSVTIATRSALSAWCRSRTSTARSG